MKKRAGSKKPVIEDRDNELRTFTVRITRGRHKAFKSKAAAEGRSLSDVVAEMVREYMERKS